MVNAVARYMPAVEDYRERLATLQGAWDTLSLLSHLSGDATDMGGTRQAFETLTGELVGSLTTETHRKTLLGLKAKSQIAIDIIVRNLYERTADIGFLSTDDDIRVYLRQHLQRSAPGAAPEAPGPSKIQIQQRFREYVAKYSVYQDVILLTADGEVVARLAEHETAMRSHDPLIAEALTTRAAYVETYRHFDLLPQQDRSLVYSFRIVDGSKVIGVLCLCFRLEDEIAGIFAKLRDPSDWTLFALLDAHGRVVASSDPWQLPVGAPLTAVHSEAGDVVRFAGREYLAITRRSHGFQGYMGPGWLGHAMVPIEHAFARNAAAAHREITAQLLTDLRDSTTIFSAGLRKIPLQAERIQRELNRAVWNGNIRLAQRADTSIHFARVLLWEIGNAGRRTQATFEQSITDLQQTVISAILDDAQLLASLAADVLDRNLYERANDCRWWALNPTLIEHLAEGAHDRSSVTAILQHINSLYTVYHDIVLFDANRTVVCVSNRVHQKRVGQSITETWCSETLALRNSQAFAVSAFAPSGFYENRPTLVYGAAIRGHAGRLAGGIGIVFDAQSQLESILRDALPRNESGAVVDGCLSLFVDATMRVVAASSVYEHGQTLPLPQELLCSDTTQSAHIACIGDTHYAVGIRHTGGYREYDATSLWCLVMIPLGPTVERTVASVHSDARTSQRLAGAADQRGGEQAIDVATFHCNGQWLGLLREQVVEAVGGGQLRAIPGSPPWHAGLLMYRDNPVPVMDLARLMDSTCGNRGGEVVLVRATAGGPLIGLLVDELAGIPTIAVSRLLPMSEAAQRSGAAIIDHAVRPEQSDDPLLLILNPQQLLLHTQTWRAAATRAAPGAATSSPRQK